MARDERQPVREVAEESACNGDFLPLRGGEALQPVAWGNRPLRRNRPHDAGQLALLHLARDLEPPSGVGGEAVRLLRLSKSLRWSHVVSGFRAAVGFLACRARYASALFIIV